MKNVSDFPKLKSSYLKMRKEEECLIINNMELEIFFLNRSSAIIFMLILDSNTVESALVKYECLYKDKISKDILIIDFEECIKDLLHKKLFIVM